MVGGFMLSFSSEAEALHYIEENKNNILTELQDEQIKTIYTGENMRINIMKDGKRLLKFINRFEDNKKLADICKDIADLKLI